MTGTGDLCADLLSNIASEQLAKAVFEYLYSRIKETVEFLLNRREAHKAAFREAFNKVQKTGSNQNLGTTKAAKIFFSMSGTSPGDSKYPNAKVTPTSFNQ